MTLGELPKLTTKDVDQIKTELELSSWLSMKVKEDIIMILNIYPELNEYIKELEKELEYIQELSWKALALPDQNTVFLFTIENDSIEFDYISSNLRQKRVSHFRLSDIIESQIWKEKFLSYFEEKNKNKWITDTDLKIILDREYIVNIAYIEKEILWERRTLYWVYLISSKSLDN